MYKQSITIFKKEIIDATRDRKSLVIALLIPVLVALTTFWSTTFMVHQNQDNLKFSISVAGANHAQSLTNWLEDSGISVIDAPENALEQVKAQESGMLLVIPEDFEKKFQLQQKINLDFYYDHSEIKIQAQAGQLSNLITLWSDNEGKKRLMSHKINPEIINPVQINSINIVNDHRMAAKLIVSLPLFFILIVFVAGIGMTSDMVAGERERKSLEPLMANPVSPYIVYFSKWAAGVCITTIIAIIGIGMLFRSVNMSPLEELGLPIHLGSIEFIKIVMILIPVIFLASSLQLLVSLLSSSFKDSQYYNNLLLLLPMAPGLYLVSNPGPLELTQMLIPLFGAQFLLNEVISSETILFSHFLLVSVSSSLLAIGFGFAGVYMLKQERTLVQ